MVVRPPRTWVVAGLALLLGGCGRDAEPDPRPPVPTLTEYLITSADYLNNRFFRLDLAHPGESSVFDVPGRDAQHQPITHWSIRVFKRILAGALEPGDVANIAAYSDSTGVFWTSPDGPPNDFQTPMVHGARWRELLFDPLMDVRGVLVGIDLRAEMNADDALAIIYKVENEYGAFLYSVGDAPGIAESERVTLPGQEGLYYRMKLLKAPEGVDARSFRYVMRNFYSLGRTNIDPYSLTFAIERNDNSVIPDRDEAGIPYIQIFGLDSRNNSNGDNAPDGLVDLDDVVQFNLSRGLVRFSMEAPFNAGRETYESHARDARFLWDDTYLMNNQAAALYDPYVLSAYYPEFAYFHLRVMYDADQDAGCPSQQ